MVQAPQSRGLLVDQVQVHWIVQIHGTLLSQLARTTRLRLPWELEQWPVSKEGTTPPEPGLCARSDIDDDSGKNKGKNPPSPFRISLPATASALVHSENSDTVPPEKSNSNHVNN